METLTPQQIVDLNPCKGYDLERITELFDNKKSVTYLEILNSDKVPLKDLVWLFCQSTILDNNIRNQWLEVITTRAVTNHALHCGIDEMEKWARNWLSGDNKTGKTARHAVHNVDSTGAAANTIYAAVHADTVYEATQAAYAATDAVADAIVATVTAHAATRATAYACYAASAANDFATCHAAHDAHIAFYAAHATHDAHAFDAAAYAYYVHVYNIEYKQQIQDLKDILQGEV